MNKSIFNSISSVLSALATTVEALPTAVNKAGEMMGDGCTLLGIHQKRWCSEAKLRNLQSNVEITKELVETFENAKKLGITNAGTIEEFIEEFSNSKL